MTNWTELKRLAEEATPGPWEITEDSADGRDEMYCYWHRIGPIEIPGIDANKDGKYIAAANPKTILALIAENERHRELATKFKEETERLRAEVEALRKDAERYRWIRKNNGDDGLCELCIPQGYSWIPFSDTDGESLDMAIDTAMDHQ